MIGGIEWYGGGNSDGGMEHDSMTFFVYDVFWSSRFTMYATSAWSFVSVYILERSLLCVLGSLSCGVVSSLAKPTLTCLILIPALHPRLNDPASDAPLNESQLLLLLPLTTSVLFPHVCYSWSQWASNRGEETRSWCKSWALVIWWLVELFGWTSSFVGWIIQVLAEWWGRRPRPW